MEALGKPLAPDVAADLLPEQWHTVKEILADALDSPPEEQSALIDARCADDAYLAGWVHQLLECQRNPGPAFSFVPSNFGPLAGTQVGPYRLEWRVGRGGFGEVYLATRRDPVTWRVAVKVLRPEYSTEALRHRFQREIRILSGFHHPGIVRILDSGTTDGGQYYVATEYIDGQSMDAYCTARRLPFRQRLSLFLRLCDAVQYAHNHCVIHCDLKPSNALVDENGNVTLLDFGIARSLYPELMGDAEYLTHASLEPTTLGYCSPEQLAGARISTATDVYALGAVLYELLTGHTPLPAEGLPVSEYAERIKHQDPPPPSKIIDSGKSTVSACQLRGDLDSIVLKALAREPEQRYTTPAQMADDLQRHLDGFPVQACPSNWHYRCRKFVRRHVTVCLAAAAVVTSLGTGLGISLSQRNQARIERQKAERRLDEIGRVATLFHATLQRLESDRTEDTRMLLSMAADFEALGDALERSDDSADAQRAYEKSAALFERAGSPKDGQGVTRKLARVRERKRVFGFAGQVAPLKGHVEHPRVEVCAMVDAYRELGQVMDLAGDSVQAAQSRERAAALARGIERAGSTCLP